MSAHSDQREAIQPMAMELRIMAFCYPSIPLAARKAAKGTHQTAYNMYCKNIISESGRWWLS
jgi:hypothetical protein